MCMEHRQHAQFSAITCKPAVLSSIQYYCHMERPSKLAGIPYNPVSYDNTLHFKKMYGKIHDMRKWCIFECLHGTLLTFCT